MSPPITHETDTIRSDIEMTRRRMDQTMDALTERLHGRHLLDEVIGFFRGSEDSSGTGAGIREKVTQSAGTATNTVVDTLKKNSLPLFLIGAGAAWLVYSTARDRSSDDAEDRTYDPQRHLDLPLEYPEGSSASQTEAAEQQGEAAEEDYDSSHPMVSGLNRRVSDLTDRARANMQVVKKRIANKVDEHPLEIGLGCLAIGIVAGLALPTPAPVRRYAGPTVDRLRHRVRDAGREILEKGKRVAETAAETPRNEVPAPGSSSTRPSPFANPAPQSNPPPAAEIARDEGKAPAAADVQPATDTTLRAGAKANNPAPVPTSPPVPAPAPTRPTM